MAKVCNLKPIGKEKVAECIKQIGNYLIENAEVMASDISEVAEIEIIGRICVDEFPSVDVNRHIQITNTSLMVDRAITEQ